jgi:hypothetical protein
MPSNSGVMYLSNYLVSQWHCNIQLIRHILISFSVLFIEVQVEQAIADE